MNITFAPRSRITFVTRTTTGDATTTVTIEPTTKFDSPIEAPLSRPLKARALSYLWGSEFAKALFR